jgi:hypothetical protein
MPYDIQKEKGGFFVVDVKGKKFSKKPLTKERAISQRKAIALSESIRHNIPIKFYFGR